ncbi:MULTISPECIES: YbhB/YbcL family Raf kinase inhibitor-like protein [unclassified Brevundimonas]|uniref:YbhB/YbcL family Raf kinase inhibitor-like protein n=2 Tax=Pseudomonadota TaxID=1224 RepID=UPI0025BCB701|nr:MULTISPECIES: YbhB/YbcL family Raf kinase inhibitor-like protein [unclassified Brevundimonas]
MKPTTLVVSLLALAAASPALAQAHPEERDNLAILTHIHEPTPRAPLPGDTAALRVPEGFTVSRFAEHLGNLRMLAVAPNGDIYATRRASGDVILLRDADGDGKADGDPVVVARRSGAHGIALHDGKMYLVTVKEVFVGDILADGMVGPLTLIIGDLPDSGQHPSRTIAVGPDDMLYISVGSTCDACQESNPENATMLRASLDGKSRTIFASGLRNTIGFGWHPRTGELWGMDHGIDNLGDELQQEELNNMQAGKTYGWPYIYGVEEGVNPQDEPPGGIPAATWAEMSEAAVAGYAAHAAPMQMAFYTGGPFPNTYDGDAFVAFRGSWARETPSGYEVARVRFENGRARAIEPFLTGFLVDGGQAETARLAGIAVAKDGSLLVGDDENGVLYRVSYGDGRGQASPLNPPATAMREQTARGSGVPLALQRVEARHSLAVRSDAFTPGGVIPRIHSEYYDGVAPALSWDRVEGAASYAILVEDPDAAMPKPFVHWVAWNIAEPMTPEGLEETIRLSNGITQGRTSRGSVGYFGPRPPVGDPAHHYHFQVFALDIPLDVLPGSDRDTVLAAMEGHVLAKGEVVGTYQQSDAPLK